MQGSVVNHTMQIPRFLALLGLVLAFVSHAEGESKSYSGKKPNIIWLVMEDISPDLGSYGNKLVSTPNLDKLADEGMRFTNAYATAPVCSTTRSAFFTGMYQTSIGAYNHRSHHDDGYQLPKDVKMVTEYLREAGYFSLLMGPKQKTDFNFNPRVAAYDADDGAHQVSTGAYTHGAVDENILGKHAWQQYKGDKPFFAQINYGEAHRTFIHDPENPINPADVTLPAYYPDHDIARRDWALYLETIQVLDKKIGHLLKELEQQNVLDNTIIFIFGDHGRAMLRDKQWLYDGGIKVPLLVWGKGIEGNQVNDELVSLIDIAPTTMDIAGVTEPDNMQGKVFLGPHRQPREYIYAQRDRCDETDDRIRAVRDARFKYIVNYYPDRPYTAFNAYKKSQYPVATLMHKLHEEGKLTAAQELFMAPKRPREELYDTLNDPDEVHNLADDPKYKTTLQEMRTALENWESTYGDDGATAEDPKVAAYWDTYFAGQYKETMEERGLSVDVSDDVYLAWWDKELKRLGK